ncbi:MAG: hypothetical protein QOH41_4251 [Blastocatellia bacterium]|jgi:hypothetical protein|nr:hypothetical protein [Blastocatellia bacterium]
MVEDRNNAIEYSDDTIRRFLLGRLSASEQPAFEQRLFSEDSLDARVRLAELDLADDYAYGRLNHTEHELFEEKFIVTADRRRKLEVSRTLRKRFAIAAPVGKSRTSFIERLRSLPHFNRPAWRYAFGVVIFILLMGTVWVAVKRESRLKEEITRRFSPRRSPTPTVPLESNHPGNSSAPEHQASPSPMPVHDQSAPTQPTVVVVALTPAVSPDSDAPSVDLPKGSQDIVRLQLALKVNEPGSYRAELLTADAQSVFSTESIKAWDSGQAQIDFDVPAPLLKTGNYQIRLSRDNAGAKENVANYYFRVR